MGKAQSPSTIIFFTALKTLTVIVLVLALAVLAFGLIAPSALGGFFNSLGLNGLALSYARTAYGRSGDVNDLATLIDRAILTESHDTVVEFVPTLLNHRQYYAFCQHSDSVVNTSLTTGSAFSYDHYVRGNYALSLSKLGRVDEALTVCRAYMRFDESTLTYHGIAGYYVLAGNATAPSNLTDFLARAIVVRAHVEGALAVETVPARIVKLESARLALYSEINGILTLLGENVADWSLE